MCALCCSGAGLISELTHGALHFTRHQWWKPYVGYVLNKHIFWRQYVLAMQRQVVLCLQIGALDTQEQSGAERVLTGLEFDELAPLEKTDAVAMMSVFARVEPSHKSRLVELLQAQVPHMSMLSLCYLILGLLLSVCIGWRLLS